MLIPFLSQNSWCEGQTSTGAGWGRTIKSESEASNYRLIRDKVNIQELQFLDLPISNEKCGPGAEYAIDTNIQICAGGEKG